MVRKLWRILRPMLVYELFYLLAALAVIHFLPQAGLVAWLNLAVVLTALLASPLFLRQYQLDQEQRELREDCLPMDPYFLIWGIAGCAALAIVANAVIGLLPVSGVSDYMDVSTELSAVGLPLVLAASVLAAPVLEELMMRALVYERIRELAGPKWAIVLSALIFGALHGNLVQGVYAFVVGLYLAMLMERFGTVLVPILGHLAANLAVILLSAGDAERLLGSGTELIIGLVACAGCVAWSVAVLNRRDR